MKFTDKKINELFALQNKANTQAHDIMSGLNKVLEAHHKTISMLQIKISMLQFGMFLSSIAIIALGLSVLILTFI